MYINLFWHKIGAKYSLFNLKIKINIICAISIDVIIILILVKLIFW